MLHEMYDAIRCVLSMFMICECNVCAYKLIHCLAEENSSLTARDKKTLTVVGENKSMTAVGDSKSLIAEDEKFLDQCWG